MRILIAAAALVMLAGCSTPSDLMAGKPVTTQFTTKDPRAVALCVYPAWQDYRSNAVMSETPTGYRIVAGSDAGQTDDVLDVERGSRGKGSIVKHYQRAAWSKIGRGGLLPALNRCI